MIQFESYVANWVGSTTKSFSSLFRSPQGFLLTLGWEWWPSRWLAWPGLVRWWRRRPCDEFLGPSYLEISLEFLDDNLKKGPNGLFRRFVGDDILPRSIGDYKINHYKDPKQTTSIVEESKRVFLWLKWSQQPVEIGHRGLSAIGCSDGRPWHFLVHSRSSWKDHFAV